MTNDNLPLYRVEFTFNDDYRPKAEGIRSINLIVLARTQREALDAAFSRIASFTTDEPKGFTASRVDKD